MIKQTIEERTRLERLFSAEVGKGWQVRMNTKTLNPGIDCLQSTKAQFRKGSPLQSSDPVNHKVGGLRIGLCGCAEVCTRWRSVSRSPSNPTSTKAEDPGAGAKARCQRGNVLQTGQPLRRHARSAVTLFDRQPRFCVWSDSLRGLRDPVAVKLVTAIERGLPLCSHAVAT